MSENIPNKFNQPIEACTCGHHLSYESIIENKVWLLARLSCNPCTEAQALAFQILDQQWESQEKRITALENLINKPKPDGGKE